ncbi:MAG TPA: DUF742 domain-containing protein [Acidimicrobiia bacterium]|nr:DUF742 domain-containing protein [Acidimicrobiia bacterium]
MSVWDPPHIQVGGRMVRPYTMTGGRTSVGERPIALEALVVATAEGVRNRHRYRWESAEIIILSRKEMAVIELAALLDVPIGVVKVLTGDLLEQGAVTVTDPPTAATEGEGYTDLLNKVLDGIKSL